MGLERLMFRKLELWAVGLLLVVAVIGALAYGAIVYDTAAGQARFGRLGQTAVLVAKTPWTLQQALREDERTLSAQPRRFDGPGGWRIADTAALDGLQGYILLSRHDGDRRRHLVELYDLSDLSLVHQWWPDAEALLADARRDWAWMDYTAWRRKAWRAIHPLLLDDGDLIVKDQYSPLFRISPCGQPVWMKDDAYYHHSTEPGAEGGFWIPTVPARSDIPGTKDWFIEDTVTLLGDEGEVLFQRSLVKLFYENGLFHRIFGAGYFYKDPLHLNDIEPVLQDGPYWKRGDLFVSLRRYSMILLYRPQTDEILWMKEGPWLDQHDIDIVDDHTIAVFNNNVTNAGNGRRVRDVSEVLFYDFATDTVSSPFRQAMKDHAVRTETEGLFTLLPGGFLMLEEENAGRLLLLSAAGGLVASFVNNSADQRGWRMGWSRYIPKDAGARAADALAGARCPPLP